MNIIKEIKNQYNSFCPAIRLGFQAAFFAVISMLGTLLYMVFQALQLGAMFYTQKDFHNILFTICCGLFFVFMLYVAMVPPLYKATDSFKKSHVKSLKFWGDTILCLVLVKVLQMFLALLLPSGTNTANQRAINQLFVNGKVTQWYLIIMSILVAPLIEETLFRWLPYTLVSSIPIAFILSVLGFTLLHSPDSWFAILIYASMASVLNINYICNGFLGSYMLHILINLSALLFML